MNPRVRRRRRRRGVLCLLGGLRPPGSSFAGPAPKPACEYARSRRGRRHCRHFHFDVSTSRSVRSRGAGVRGTPGAAHDAHSPIGSASHRERNTNQLTTIIAVLVLYACSEQTASRAPPDAGVTDARAHMPADVARDVVLPPCDPTFPSIQKNVFDVACSEGTCHGPPTPAWGLILTDGPAARERLVGKVAQSCTEFFLVTPGEPAASFLWLKVSSPRPPCGEPMPFGGPPLPAWSRSCIRDWISSLGAGTDGAADSGL